MPTQLLGGEPMAKRGAGAGSRRLGCPEGRSMQARAKRTFIRTATTPYYIWLCLLRLSLV